MNILESYQDFHHKSHYQESYIYIYIYIYIHTHTHIYIYCVFTIEGMEGVPTTWKIFPAPNFLPSPPNKKFPPLKKHFKLSPHKNIIFSCSYCSCPIFVLILYFFDAQVTPESSCARKENVDIDIHVTSRNGDRTIMQSIKITSRPPSRKRKWNQLSQVR